MARSLLVCTFDEHATVFTFLTLLTATAIDARARTIFGWTPGLRELAGGRVLACGCLAGIYNTWSGTVISIIDARGEACPHDDHAEHAIIPEWRRRDAATS